MIRINRLWNTFRNVVDLQFTTPKETGESAMTIRTELLESRFLFAVHNDSFDVTQLTQLRSDPSFSSITGTGVDIAVLDTGVDAQNPDLSSKVKAYYNAVENAIPTSIDASSVANAVDNDGHGTHTSGIAASADPNIGVAYGAGLVDVKVIPDSGETQLSGDPLLRGLQFVQDFAGQFNIKVVSMSLGESDSNGGLNLNSVPAADDISREISTLESLGITVVAAAGNSYANNPVPGESYPAVVSTISVASTWSDTGAGNNFGTYAYGTPNDSWAAVESSAAPDQFSATSQRSTLPNQVVAPGVNIYSDWNGSSTGNSGTDLLHNTLSGTSMATPFVSGMVALMQQAAKLYGGHYISNPQQILTIIKDTSDKIPDPTIAGDGRVPISNGQLVSSTVSPLPGTGDTYDRVNVLKAVEAVKALFTGAVSNADTDNTTAAATVVPDLNGTQVFTEDGSIGTDGLNNVGANDVDVYRVVLDSPGTLTVALSQPSGGTSFTASVRFFDSTGTQLDRADGTSSTYPTLTTSTTTPLTPGTYYIAISSLGNDAYNIIDGTGATGGSTQGDYSVSFSLTNPDPNGVPQGALAVDLTNPTIPAQGINQYVGILGSDPPATGTSTRISVPNGDVDMFKVIAPDTGTVTADVLTSIYGFGSFQNFPGADSYVRVFDSSLNQIAADGQSSTFFSDSSVTFPVTFGDTYYVAVTNYANKDFSPSDPFTRVTGSTASQTQYEMNLSFNNGNTDGTAYLAQAVTIGQTVTGSISSPNPAFGEGGGAKYVDWYNYTASADGLLDLSATATSSGYAPTIQLWTLSSDNQSISQIGSISGSGKHLIDQVSAGQTVYVSTTGLGNSNFNWFSLGSGSGGVTGSYSLSSTLRPLSDLSQLNDGSIDNGTPQTITTGQIVSGNIGTYNGLLIGTSDVDLYKFVPTTSGLYDIRTDTSQEGSVDTLLRLFDSSGNQITQNDNASSATTASFVRTELTAGQTYYIGVSASGNGAYDPVTGSGTAAGNSTGNYVLSANVANIPAISIANPPPVQQPIGSATADAVFTVSLDFAATTPVTVNYTTADNTAVAGVDYTATSGTLTFPAGTTSETISVPILSNLNATDSTSFFLNLSSPSSNAVINGGEATGTITNLPVTKLQFTKTQKETYTDANGQKVTVLLAGPGTGQISLIGSGADEQVEIQLNDSTAKSELVISDIGKSLTTISDLQINGSLVSLQAPRVDLEGDLTITGTVRSLKLAKAAGGHTLSIQGSGANAVLSLGDVSDLTVSSVEPITSLVDTQWLTTAGADVITAPLVRAINSKGDFSAGLTLTNTGMDLNAVRVGGAITGGTWTVDGSAGTIIAKATDTAWSATFAGSVNELAVTTDAGGSVTAGSIRVLHVSKNLTGASINLTGTGPKPSLGTFSVGGTVSDTQLHSAGNINTVQIGALVDSTIFAGVDPSVTGLPTDASAFVNPAAILSFNIAGLRNETFAMTNSVVAAETLRRVTVRRVDTSNGGTPFGFATESLASFADVEPKEATFKWTPKKSASLLTFNGDFKVELV